MNVLGVNYFFQDTSACILANGKLVAAIEQERLSRNKHTTDFPVRAVEQCLAIAGLTYKDIDHVALSVKPWLGWASKVAYAAIRPIGGSRFVRYEIGRLQRRQRALMRWLVQSWGVDSWPKLHFVDHHLSHAAGSFYVSPFEEAALLCLDGSGEWATSFLGVGRGNEVERYKHSSFPMSLGSFYESVTEFCGFRPNYDEGKTMGLAPYGNPHTFLHKVAQMARVDRRGGIDIDLSYFRYQYHEGRRCAQKFEEAFGPARKQGEEFRDRHKDAAAAFQAVLEERALTMCRMLKKRTGCRYLVLSGGVALNSVMNGRILRDSGFDDIYVMPGAGDNGTSIGAAAHVYHSILGQKRKGDHVHDNPYLGPLYDETEITDALSAHGLKGRRSRDIESLVADLLHEGKIIGWFQGRSEFGPRALGNRSILANPTLYNMKEVLNARVKHREAFRPFAPSVLAERANEYFDISVQAPFMLRVCEVRHSRRPELPAITHVDGTARLQTVHRDTNPRYHKLVEEFEERSGVPVVLNTSFNVVGQPILETPYEAVECFASTGIDALAIGDYIVEKGVDRGPGDS